MSNPFQLWLRRELNHFFQANGLRAYAYRMRQARWSRQTFDIFVDSAIPRYYLALECKMVKPKCMYFSTHMKDTQIAEETQYLGRTGRTGILCIKHLRKVYMVPWDQLLKLRYTKKLRMQALWRWEAVPSKGLWFRSFAPCTRLDRYECVARYKPYDLPGKRF